MLSHPLQRVSSRTLWLLSLSKLEVSMDGLSLWSKRWSVARGWIWVHERRVSEDTKDAWMKIFKTAEPDVDFVVNKKKPR